MYPFDLATEVEGAGVGDADVEGAGVGSMKAGVVPPPPPIIAQIPSRNTNSTTPHLGLAPRNSNATPTYANPATLTPQDETTKLIFKGLIDSCIKRKAGLFSRHRTMY
jgi:hypothetical protein